MKTMSRSRLLLVYAFLTIGHGLSVFTLAAPANAQICTSPPAGLVSWWPLDEVTGTTADDIVGGNDGTLTGTTSVSGKVSTARRFVPGNRMDASGSGSLDISGNQVTVDAWIRLENNPTPVQRFTGTVGKTTFPDNQSYQITFESGPIGGGVFTLPQNQWRFEYILTNSDGFRVHNQNTGIDVTVDGQYHHFAMTYDGTNVAMYVDGVLRGSFPFSGNLKSVPTEPFRILGGAPGGPPFSIDEVEIAGRALTAAEIQAIFNAGSAGKCKPVSVRAAYVANLRSNSVSVIDPATNTVTATIPVGLGPIKIALSPDGARAYVANTRSNSVSVIDTTTNTAVATVTVGANPVDLAVTPDGAHAYVTNAGSNTVSVIDTTTETVVATIPVGRAPASLAITADGTRAYVTNTGASTVSVIDTTTNTVVATVTVGLNPVNVILR
jgi:YVTN family beta-propeller protein